MTDDASATGRLAQALSETDAHLSESRAAGVPTEDALRAMRNGRPRLTAAQRRRVRELMEDEGESRASAVAWVLNMGAGS